MTPDTRANRFTWVTLAGIAYADSGKIGRELEKHERSIGAWRLTWLAESHDGANLAYVAESLDTNTWAVIVRGSLINPLDKGFWTDWALEDLQVLDQVPVPFGFDTPKARIAAGTNLAFEHFMSMRSQVEDSEGLSLETFLLDKLVAGQDNLWFVGHSLGGAMVPLLAAWFQNIVRDRGAMDTKWITPVTFAGPTGGNPAFARALEERFEGFPLRYVNDLDMVPHTWSPHGLRWIMNSYDPAPRIPGWFRFTCKVVKFWMWFKRIRYAHAGSGIESRGKLAGKDPWFSEVEHQHSIETYLRLYEAPKPACVENTTARQ